MEEKMRQFGLLVFALLFAALAGAYYLHVVPLQERENELTTRLAKLSQTVDQVQSTSVREKQADSERAVADLVEAIPVKPYVDQLIKDMDRLQEISQVEIEEASFAEQEKLTSKNLADQLIYTDKDDANSKGQEANAELLQSFDAGQTDSTESTGQTDQAPVLDADRQIKQEIIEKYLPAVSFNSIEITLKISGNYEQIYSFVTEAQKLSRYLRVDQLDFTTTQKQEFVIPDEEKMSATVKLTSYFAPQFESVVKKHPGVQVEAPSGKWNPMQYDILKKEDTPFHSTSE